MKVRKNLLLQEGFENAELCESFPKAIEKALAIIQEEKISVRIFLINANNNLEVQESNVQAEHFLFSKEAEKGLRVQPRSQYAMAIQLEAKDSVIPEKRFAQIDAFNGSFNDESFANKVPDDLAYLELALAQENPESLLSLFSSSASAAQSCALGDCSELFFLFRKTY